MRRDLLLDTAARYDPPPRQTLEEHARQRVDVGARVDGVVLEPFGRHVGDGADGAARTRQRRVVGAARDAEVDEVGEIRRRDEDVRRFDVAMDEPGCMGGLQRCGHLLQDVDCPCGFHGADGGEFRLQVAPLDEPHVDVQLPVEFAEAMDRHHVWLRQARGDLCFAQEPLPERGVPGQLVRKHLERHDAVGGGVECAVDPPHPALADERLQHVMPKRCLVDRLHRRSPYSPERLVRCATLLIMTTPAAPVLLPHLWKSAVVSGVLAIALGVAVLIWTGASITLAAIFFGVALLFTGIQQVFFAFTLRTPVSMRLLLFISGAAALVLAAIALSRLSDAWKLLAIWIAIGFIFRGVATTVSAISDPTLPGRVWNIGIGVLTLIAGIVVMAAPAQSLATLAIIVGVWLIVIGVMEIAAALAIRKAMKGALPPQVETSL